MSVQEDNQQPPVRLAPLFAVYSQIPPPPPMNMKGNLAENWKLFKKSWNNYKVATELDKKAQNVVLETLYTVLDREANQFLNAKCLTQQVKGKMRTLINT